MIGYLRVSTEEQATSGLGLAAQRAAITAEAERRGWEVEWIADEGYSAKNLNRPGIADALARLGAGEADGLVVAKLDRVSRSVIDFIGLLDRAAREGWALVVLDLALDTTTPMGRFVAVTMANVAELERNLIGLRTKEALAARKAQGVRLGRPAQTPHPVVRRIVKERATGASLRTIANALNAEAVPTVAGGREWYASTVAAVLRAQERAMS